MIQKIVQSHEIDPLDIDPFVFDHLHFNLIDVKILVRDIVIVIKHSILIEIHHVQDTPTLITNEETTNHLTLLLSKKFTINIFHDPPLEIDSILENIIFHIDLHQDHVHDQSPDLDDYMIMYNKLL